MLLPSPLVACGVPKRGGQTKYPRKTSEFGDSTAGCHGERNISQETREREQASQLPLRCIRETEYLGGSVWQCWQEGGHDTEGIRNLGTALAFCKSHAGALVY